MMFVRWFYKDKLNTQLDFTKVLTAIPFISAVGYVLIHFIMFLITALIYTYYKINVGYFKYNESNVFQFILISLVFLSMLIYLGTVNKLKAKIDRIFTRIAAFVSLLMLFGGFLENAKIEVESIVEAYAIFVIGIFIIFIVVLIVPRILKSLKSVVIAIISCVMLTVVLIVTMNTCWESTYDTVNYDSKSYIIGTSTSDQFYLIEYSDNKILCNHYRLVDKTQVAVVRQKLDLHIEN